MVEKQGSYDLSLDGSFLQDLPPLIKRYTYHGKSQFFDILKTESAHFKSSIKSSEFLLFHVSRETIENIFDLRNEDEDPSISKLSTSFDKKEQLLLVTMPSEPHSVAADVVNTMIRQTLVPMGLMTALHGYPGANIEGEDRGKQPDYGWGPRRKVPGQPRNPSVTLEIAYSESDSKLNTDVRFWLNTDHGNAKISLTLRIDRSRPQIRIEKWERQDDRAHRSQVIWVTKQGGQIKVTDHPLLIPFESLFRYQPTFPREKDLEISQQQLEEIATTIWEVQWDQQSSPLDLDVADSLKRRRSSQLPDSRNSAVRELLPSSLSIHAHCPAAFFLLPGILRYDLYVAIACRVHFLIKVLAWSKWSRSGCSHDGFAHDHEHRRRASNPPPPSNSASSPISDQTPQKRPKKAASYSEYPTRPPQPPPLQHPQHASPERSSPYASVQSPYQQFNSGPVINTAARSQRSQTPPHISTPYGPGTRDQFGASAYGSHPQHPGGPLVSPYTPQPLSAGPQHPEQPSYFAQQRSQQRSQSLQSVMTTPRAPVESYRSPPVASQPLPLQHFSPTAHRSVPGTPLGPPPAFTTHQSPSTARPPSSGHDSPGNPLSSPRPKQEALIRDQIPTQSPVTQQQFSLHNSQPSEPTHLPPGGLKQEPTESASPKSISRHNSIITASESATAGQIRSSEDRVLVESPTAQKPTVAGSDFLTSPLAPGSQMNSSPSGARGGAHAVDMEIDHEPRVDAQQPKQKRRRYNEPPIYARLTPRNTSRRPIIPNPRPPVPKHARQSQQYPSLAARRRSSSIKAVTPVTRVTRAPAVASPSTSMPRVQAPPALPAPSLRPPSTSQTVGSLGPWEPSITGFIPHEEVTKTLCDFLFQHVVMRNDVNAGPTGSAAAGKGTIIEIEAKLGHIIDMDSRDRIHLPILTESVLNRENTRIRTSFESKMTVEQHRAMNNFLNEAVKASMPQANSTRIPLAYVHKKERDTFYEIQASDLPPVIRQNLNPRHKPKVRVTTDERTGEIIAKIVKCRVADVDVCSPRTTVDWRVSVNLEMEYTGDVSHLPVIDAAVVKGGRGDRIKDRMSYSHLAYQVDLTQVAKSDQQPGKNEFDHELEVEVSAEEIRRQGQLAMSGDPKNQYEDLVKGFVDNIRVLARAVPP